MPKANTIALAVSPSVYLGLLELDAAEWSRALPARRVLPLAATGMFHEATAQRDLPISLQALLDRTR